MERTEWNTERNEAIHEMYCDGYSMRYIANFFGISAPRVNQILDAYDRKFVRKEDDNNDDTSTRTRMRRK